MLKFFRNIRQRLLTENKFSKYLLYAIGEIVLVVLGILIALSVNNWKETSSQRKIEKLFLVDLLHDLTLDSIQLESMLEIDTERFRTKPLLLKFLRKESTLPDSIEVYFDKQFNVPMTPFTPNVTTIEEGKSWFWQIVDNWTSEKIPIIFLANKWDLDNKLSLNEIIKKLELNRLSEKYHGRSFNIYDCSVKTGYNVNIKSNKRMI